MVVLIAWAVAVFVALLVVAALALGLRGHLARFRRAAEGSVTDLAPVLDTLQSGTEQLRMNARRTSPGGVDGHPTA